jgi:hypothetical protein
MLGTAVFSNGRSPEDAKLLPRPGYRPAIARLSPGYPHEKRCNISARTPPDQTPGLLS